MLRADVAKNAAFTHNVGIVSGCMLFDTTVVSSRHACASDV